MPKDNEREDERGEHETKMHERTESRAERRHEYGMPKRSAKRALRKRGRR